MTHPLEDYFAASGEIPESFAARIGVEPAQLRAVIAGAPPPLSLARRIVEATGGAILFEALFEGAAARVADFGARRCDREAIDTALLAPLLSDAFVELGFSNEVERGLLARMAAEAAADTHAALAATTTRRGPDRLHQALAPVIEEILAETPDLQDQERGRDQTARRIAREASNRYFERSSFLTPQT